MSLSTLSALSPLDGRYASKVDALRSTLSEAGFMHHRVKVEIAWLQALSQAGFAEIKPFSSAYLILIHLVAVLTIPLHGKRFLTLFGGLLYRK